MRKIVFFALFFLISPGLLLAAENAPWGSGNNIEIKYKPNKVVYDVHVNSVARLQSVLNRASYLSKVYQADPFSASIVIVLHGGEIPFFAVKNYKKYKDLMIRAESLTHDEVIKFRMCKIAASAYHLKPKDIHGFVEVIPMADAEIIRLQRDEGYAYMR